MKPETNNTLSRRKFIAAAAATTGAIAAVSSPLIFVRQARAADKLRILTWPGYDEPEVIGEFEDKHKVKVEFKTYIGGEQMLQFFSQTPRGTFDGIISDAEYVTKLNTIKAIEPVKVADIPELANYHPLYRKFPLFVQGEDQLFGVPTRFSFYGISYNTKFLKPDDVKSWEILFNPELKGKVGLFDWYLPNMGNASLAVSPKNQTPYAISDDQLQKVKDWLLKLKPNLGVITPQTQDIVTAMLNEDVIAAPVGDLDLSLIVEGHDNFASTVPDEGSIRWSEGAALCADSKNKELALEWIKYMSQPDIQAKLAYTKAFKARSPNLKVVDHWDDTQKKLLGYVPDPANPGKLVVEGLIEKSVPRALPSQQPEKAWQDLYTQFKTS